MTKQKNKGWEKRFDRHFAISGEKYVDFAVEGLKEWVADELERQKKDILEKLGATDRDWKRIEKLHKLLK